MKLVLLGVPQSLMRARHTYSPQAFSRTYDPPENQVNKLGVVAAWTQVGRPTFDRGEPLHLKMTCHFPRPNSHFGTGKNAGQLKDSAPSSHHAQRPDLSNLLKLPEDALNGLAWHDDAQIARVSMTKLWCAEGREPQTVIEVEPL